MVGTDDGNVQLTKDGGKTWTNLRGKIPGMPVGAWVPQIRASRYNAGEAFVVCNDYRRGDFKPYIFRTKNFGETWERMIDENKVKGYALCMIQDPVEPNLVFVGTEQGLWISFDNGGSFQQWKHGYPSVSTYDLAIQEREADLCIATFGRAMYVLDDIRPLRKAAASNSIVVPSNFLTVFEPPVAYQVNKRKVAGYDYSSWGVYEGENKKMGAAYSFYVNKQPAIKVDSVKNKKGVVAKITDTSKVKVDKLDSAFVKIYANDNELIRTIKVKADSGFNRYYWNFDRKGSRKPGSVKPQKGEDEPSGLQVFPGVYKIVVSLGKGTDSALIVVKPDPAAVPNKEVYDAKMAAIKRLDKSNDKLVEITDRLTDADETISKVEASLKNIETPEADSLRKTSKAITDSIKNIRSFIFGKPLEKQGYGRVYQVTVNGKLQDARDEITNKNKIPAAQEFALIEIAESLVAESIKKTNAFFNGKWAAYQKQADTTPMKLFKEYNTME